MLGGAEEELMMGRGRRRIDYLLFDWWTLFIKKCVYV
jgi:hypothetical protein